MYNKHLIDLTCFRSLFPLGCHSYGFITSISSECVGVDIPTLFLKSVDAYPLVNQHSNGKSPFLMGKSTINGHFPLLC